MSFKKRVYLTFPKDRVTDPVICTMYDKFKVRFNIRSATVNDHMGVMALELEGENETQVDKALDFFRTQGLTAEPIEMDVITG